MNKNPIPVTVLLLILLSLSCNAPGDNNNTSVLITTTMGDIKILLYDNTPVHRDNFIRLVNSGLYNNVIFHRVIKDFMVQTGDLSTSPSNKQLPDSLSVYTIPAEFNSSCYHKKGAVAAARIGNDQNPYMRSSGSQFYIVQGVKFSDQELDKAQQTINNNIRQAVFGRFIRQVSDSLHSSGKDLSDSEIQEIASVRMFDYLTVNKEYKIPDDQREVYKTIGGVPRLDGTYTVFGEVTEGLDIVDKIASVSTDISDKPLSDVRILKMKIIRK